MRPTKILKMLLLSSLLCCTGLWSERVYHSLRQPYDKDLRSGYLLAQALWHGVEPYQPLPELAKNWLPGHPVTNLPHATPHPFAVGWLCLPLVGLNYPQAAVAWLMFEILCLLAAIVLWLRLVAWPVCWLSVAALSVLLSSWIHLMTDLFLGQLTILLLLLFLAAWTALRAGRDSWGGVWLGLLLLLKLMGWPLLLWLAWQRRWRAIAAAGAIWTGAHGLALALHGWAMIQTYYLKVGPAVASFYRAYDSNFSLLSLGARFFEPAGHYLMIVPLWESPGLVKALTLLVPLGFLGWLLHTTSRLRCFDTAFALLMGAGTLLSPVVWSHYLILALPALGLVLQRLAQRAWPYAETGLMTVALVLLWLPLSVYFGWAAVFALHTTAAGIAVVPAWAAAFTLLPLLALGLLFGCLLRGAPVLAVPWCGVESRPALTNAANVARDTVRLS